MPNFCYFPEDVLLEIFVRLPFKSTCKFRYGGSSTLWTLVTRYWFKSAEYKFDGAIHKMSFISTSSTQLHHEIISSKDGFSFNFVVDSSMLNKQEERCMFPLASSNGLLPCSFYPYSPGDYFICNPFTRQCVPLPPVYGCAGLTGFVFESSTGTYKVIHIPYYYSKSGNFNLHIFLSDTREWSTREVTCSHQTETRIHSCVQIVNHSGTWYWIDGGGNNIIAYNDNHNNGSECRLLNLPEGRSRVGFWQQCLGESKGLLCYGQIENARQVSTISVWVFQDGCYTNGSTWLLVCKDIDIGDFICVSSRPRYNFVAFSPVDQDVVIFECRSGAHAHEVAYNIKTRKLEALHSSHPALVASGCYYKSDRRIMVPLWPTIIPTTRN